MNLSTELILAGIFIVGFIVGVVWATLTIYDALKRFRA